MAAEIYFWNIIPCNSTAISKETININDTIIVFKQRLNVFNSILLQNETMV